MYFAPDQNHTYPTVHGMILFALTFLLLQKLRHSYVHLRNEFDFWKVHEIMNTSGLLQSK